MSIESKVTTNRKKLNCKNERIEKIEINNDIVDETVNDQNENDQFEFFNV